MATLYLRSDAIISPCGLYRYSLCRIWDEERPLLNVVGLNPSKADGSKDDNTIRKCVKYAKAWGYGGLLMTNLFAFRATDPRMMKRAIHPIGSLNDFHLQLAHKACAYTLVAWGNHGTHLERNKAVMKIFTDEIHCLGVTKSNQPKHPLYLLDSLTPYPYNEHHN